MSRNRMKLSRRSFLAGCSAATFVTLSKQGNATEKLPPHDSVPANLKPLIDRTRKIIRDAMAKQDIPGGAVSLIYQGKLVWTEGFGVTDRASATPVDPRTIFSIQSTSKHFTATAIMLAVQKGLLDLDEPITTYLPDFSVHSRFENDPQKKMNLRLLLSHRAGFTHEAPVGNNYYPEFPSFEAHVRSISDTWLRYPVGERFSYSNLGIDLAGYILEKVTGTSFALWVKAMIFDPLGMTDSTLSGADYMPRKNRALGHAEGHEPRPIEIPLIPSGGVYASARDMATYALFHLNAGRAGNKQILERKYWEEMHAFPFAGWPYGLGVWRQRLRFGETVVDWLSHDGGGFGFINVFSYYPQAGLAWTACFNKPDGEGRKAFDDSVSQEILAGLYGAKKPVMPASDLQTVDVPQDVREDFAGNYVGRGGGIFEIKFADGVLGMKAGDSFQKLSFTSKVDAFFTDESGEAIPLRLEAANDDRPQFLRCSEGPSFGDLDYNDSPTEPPGRHKPEWQKYVGDYQMRDWGKPETVKVHVKNGYLYVDDRKLVAEPHTALFFTSDGEALDFRRQPPTFFNIPLERARPVGK